MRRRWPLYAGLAALLFAGCAKTPGADDLSQALQFADAEQWDDALPLLKNYAEAHPFDPSVHLLLGKANLYGQAPAIGVAIGELQLALHLGEQSESGDIGAMRGTMDARAFALAAHEESAYAHVWWIQSARAQGVPVPYVVPRLHEALRETKAGRELDPESPSLKQLEERIQYYIDQYENGRQEQRPRRRPNQETPAPTQTEGTVTG